MAYYGGTSVGHGPVRTRFPEPDFASRVGTLDVGHGPVRTLFLSLVLCLVLVTPYKTLLYWSHMSALVGYNGGSSVGNGPVRTLSLEPDFVSSVGTLDVGHGPVTTLCLSPVLCLVLMTPCGTISYLPHISASLAYNGGASIGHGPVTTLCSSLALCLVPMTPCETMLYWSHKIALVP